MFISARYDIEYEDEIAWMIIMDGMVNFEDSFNHSFSVDRLREQLLLQCVKCAKLKGQAD